MLRTTIYERDADLAGILEDWDGLAVDLALPYASPAWMLGWWRHLAPAGARLHVTAVHEADALIGLGAFSVAPEAAGARHARLLAARYGGTPLGPLARPGREDEVAGALATALASVRPRVHAVHLDGVPAASPWPSALAHGWPGPRLIAQREARRPLPTITAAGTTFEAWMGTKSSNFRQTLRRRQRQLQEKGAVVRMSASLADVERDLRAFERLHESRWVWRGGSGRLRPQTTAFLLDVARDLLPKGRFRLWQIDLDGQTISSHLFICGGGRANYWLGGFDDAYARYSPAMVTLLAGIQDAWSNGDASIGLGAGKQAYKGRFTSDAEDLDWLVLVPPRALLAPRGAAGLGPALGRTAVRNAVPPAARARLRGVLARTKGMTA